MAALNVRKIIHDYNRRVKRVDIPYQLTVRDFDAIWEESRGDHFDLLNNGFFVGYEQGRRAAQAEMQKAVAPPISVTRSDQRSVIAAGELRHAEPEARQTVHR